MSTYRVKGTQRFRGYLPGEVFVGLLTPQAEARAIKRGVIELVEAGPIRLDATRATLPRGWHEPAERSE